MDCMVESPDLAIAVDGFGVLDALFYDSKAEPSTKRRSTGFSSDKLVLDDLEDIESEVHGH